MRKIWTKPYRADSHIQTSKTLKVYAVQAIDLSFVFNKNIGKLSGPHSHNCSKSDAHNYD